MKKLLLLITCNILLICQSKAQGLSFNWAKQMGGHTGDYAVSVAVDNQGNVYSTGVFSDTADFNPGVGVYNFISKGQGDMFIQKVDANGNFLWAKQMGGIDNDWSYGISIDADKNVYTTGVFLDTVDFDPGAAVYNLVSKGGWDIFVQKLDSNGNFLWVKQMGGTGYDWVQSLTTNASGSVYVAGAFVDTVDFDPNAPIHNLISKGNGDYFLQKLDANGNLIWVNQTGSMGDDRGNAITIYPNGNIYVTGYFQDTVDFDSGTSVYNLMSANGSNFIQKVDSNGNFIWVKQIGGVSYGITVDATENVYTTGTFSGTVDFNPAAATYSLTALGTYDVYLEKLDATGNFIWAKQIGGVNGNNDGRDIATDINKNVYLTGSFQNTADFDPGSANLYLTSKGGDDMFIQKLDSTGNFLWAKQIGDIGQDESISITTDANGYVYNVGAFSNTTYFDTNYSLTSYGTVDAFVQKLGQCASQYTYATKNITACHFYKSQNQIYTSSGAYNQIVGCDSIITLNLTILSTNASATNNGTVLTAVTAGASYQWVSCNFGKVPIPGATNQSYTATINGSYAVIVTKNGCADTSSCYVLAHVDINQLNSITNYINIYPNPAQNNFTVEVSSTDKQTISVFDVNGKQVLSQIINDKAIVDVSNLSSGVYNLSLISNAGVVNKRLVIVK